MSLELVWFWLTALVLAAYLVLDGFDLGAGILHLFVARTPGERRVVMRSIGPVWDGNEVWLLAGGATLFMAFPKLYATGVSGFYLPVMILLWLYVFRALGIEMKHQLSHGLWDEAWDAAFAGSSLLVTLFLWIAVANVVRGVTFDASGRFFAPLFTHFGVDGEVGILDWYTLTIGLTGVALVSLHGALWLGHRTGGEVAARSMRIAPRLLFGCVALSILSTTMTMLVQPQVGLSLRATPLKIAFPLLAAGALAGIHFWLKRGDARRAFFASSALLASLFGTMAASIHPFVLPGRAPGVGLTAEAAAASPYGLEVGLIWWLPGIALATAYTVVVYRTLPARVGEADDTKRRGSSPKRESDPPDERHR